MQFGARKILDRCFTGLGAVSIGLVGVFLVIILAPIIVRGLGAFVFRSTAGFRLMMLEEFERGDRAAIKAEQASLEQARQPVYDALAKFKEELRARPPAERRAWREAAREVEEAVRELLGPGPGERRSLARNRYGQTRWDRALVKQQDVIYETTWDHSGGTGFARKKLVPRSERFRGTALEPLFPYVEQNLQALLAPRWTFYWRFLLDTDRDANYFGGIWAPLLGTLYLTVGAILFAVPLGLISAIYLVEYAGQSWWISVLRSCISTLAGVPSIVFGLFGLAFFINTLHVSPNRSVLAGSLTLAALILPVIIRAAEEAIRAVPRTYKEAALSVGATKWHTIVTVVLPAALPGILTGIVISMGRAAGETAPIIFTAAVSAGQAVPLWEVFTRGTPALSWNVYNLATEHEAASEIRHVQYGMVLTLVALVLLLNFSAILLRARVARRLTG